MDLFNLYEGAPPVFSVLDHRLMFIWSAMKGMKWQMPYTSLVEAKYLEMVSQGKKAYLLITHDRKGFVAEVPSSARRSCTILLLILLWKRLGQMSSWS